MSRRSGQAGHVEKSGRWYVVRYWLDVPGQEKRSHKRERICPVSGAGSLNQSARERRAREIVAASGADTAEHFEKVVLCQTGVTFREQSKVWFDYMSFRKSDPVAPSTLETWAVCLRKRLVPILGDLPLTAFVEDQTPAVEFVSKLHAEGRAAKTIRNYVQVLKAVVASAKDKKSRKQLYPVPWDEEFLDIPAIRKQNTPCFTGAQVTLIVARASGQYRVMFAVLAASGLRFGEILGLKIENVRDGGQRLIIVEKNWKGVQQDFLKTINGERTVELHSSVAAMLREHIGDRTAGFVFPNIKGKAHSQTNIIRRYLHPILLGNGEMPGVTGAKAGNHAFRRYRNSYLRKKSCPAGLLKYWLGHSRRNDMSDVYDKSPEDFEWRAEMAEQLGVGFSLPSCTACSEKTKTAALAAAV
jgi:integrase